QDPTGNTMQTVSWSFTTSGPDVTAPTIVSKTPAPGAFAVPLNTVITATFSESLQFPTISFELKDANNNAEPASITYDDSTHTVLLAPAGEDDAGFALTLNPSTTYTLTLSGAKDLAGNTMQPVTWSFTTDAAISGTSLWSNSTTPAVASYNDLTAIEV